MKYKYLKKGELYYIRLPHGYLRVQYICIKDHQRKFHSLNGATEYSLSMDEVNRLVARVPRQKGALKRLAAYKKFNKGSN